MAHHIPGFTRSHAPASCSLHRAEGSEASAAHGPLVSVQHDAGEHFNRSTNDNRRATYHLDDVHRSFARRDAFDRFPGTGLSRAAVEGLKDMYLLVKVAAKLRKLTNRILQRIA